MAQSRFHYSSVLIPWLVVAAVLAGYGARAAARLDIVRIETGRISGVDDGIITAFRGIPYAAAPVGSLRWRPPQAATAWKGVRAVDQVGALCPQKYNAADNGVGPLPMSEDCLTLNVFAPDKHTIAALPVMFWIHGGGYVNGSGTAALYDGTELAKQGVVVVTMNYRLGRLGFFAHPALSTEHPTEFQANFGLMDQIAALHWVRHNIRAFGGNPGNVTIFGESAGGGAVNLLMISPAARGLFHRAISQSGVGRGPPFYLDRSGTKGEPSAESLGLEFARLLGVTSQSAAALRQVPIDKILEAEDQGSIAGGGPVIDGKIVPDAIDKVFERGGEALVPYIAGSNALEFPSATVSNPGHFGGLLRLTEEQKARVLSAYDTPHAFDVSLISDLIFTEPARRLARLHSEHGAPAYLYRFSVLSQAAPKDLSAAPHASDRQYVFKTLGASTWPTGPMDAGAADTISAYWIAFARTGDPNGDGRTVWPQYVAREDRLLDLTNDGPVVRPVPAARALDAIAQSEREPTLP
jgi:para-nitrobenzyl esterase